MEVVEVEQPGPAVIADEPIGDRLEQGCLLGTVGLLVLDIDGRADLVERRVVGYLPQDVPEGLVRGGAVASTPRPERR